MILSNAYRPNQAPLVRLALSQSQPQPVVQSSANVSVRLRGDWALTALSDGDIVHVIGARSCSTSRGVSTVNSTASRVPQLELELELEVDDDSGLVIVNPDCLVSGTVIGGSFPCVRKSVLSDTLPTAGVTALAALQGTLSSLSSPDLRVLIVIHFSVVVACISCV